MKARMAWLPTVAAAAVLALAMASACAQSDTTQPGQDTGAQPSQNPGAQSNPGQAAGGQNSANESDMAIPPTVSGATFPISFATAERSNFLGIGLMGGVSYVTNVFLGEGVTPVNDELYSVWPSVTLETTNERWRENFTYSPGFQSYQHATALNQISHNATAAVSYQFGPHSTLSLHDLFLKTSNAFSQPYSLTTGTVSGSPGTPAALVIAPYANQISNDAGGLFSHQFSRKEMFGVGGGASQLDYPDRSQAAGLFNSNSYNGNAFFDLRMSTRQYVGVTANYFHITEYPTTGADDTQTSAAMPFYAFYLRRNIIFAASGGPQYYEAAFPPALPVRGWKPTILASIHAATVRTVFSISYQRSVTAGGGLLGAFTTDSGGADLRVQLGHDWIVDCRGTYANYQTLVPLPFLLEESGHTLSGAASLSHHLTEHLSAEVGYDYLHQNYAAIPVVANAPDSQRVYGTMEYQLRRPLGR